MTKRRGILKTLLAGVMVGSTLLWGGQTGHAANIQTQQATVNKVTGQTIIQIGKQYLGTPYQFGSSSSTTRTFDCSSFTQRVFKKAGIQLPRNSRQQSKIGTAVSKSNLQVGDLIFFKSYRGSSKRITHVAIYAGNNKILHTYGKPGVT